MANWQQKLSKSITGIKGVDRNIARLTIRIDSLDDFFGTKPPRIIELHRELIVAAPEPVNTFLVDGKNYLSSDWLCEVGTPTTARQKNNRRQAESTLPYACPVFKRTKGAKPDNPESGALSHSRAAANVPLRGVAPFPLVGLDRVASQQPPESITARDWSGDDRKAKKTTAVRRNQHYLTPVARSAQRQAQSQTTRNQERYRTAGRVLPRSP